jgi:hypothetical protein
MTFGRAGGRRTYPGAHLASVEVGTPTNRATSAVVYRGVSKRPLVVIFSALVSAPRSYPSPRPPRQLCRETAQEPRLHRSAPRCSGPGRGLGAQAPRELIGPLADADHSTPRASSIVSADFDAAQAGLAISRKPRIALYGHYAAARDASRAVSSRGTPRVAASSTATPARRKCEWVSRAAAIKRPPATAGPRRARPRSCCRRRVGDCSLSPTWGERRGNELLQAGARTPTDGR